IAFRRNIALSGLRSSVAFTTITNCKGSARESLLFTNRRGSHFCGGQELDQLAHGLRKRHNQIFIVQEFVDIDVAWCALLHGPSEFRVNLSLIWKGAWRLGALLEEIDHVEIEMNVDSNFDVTRLPSLGCHFCPPVPRYDSNF